MNLVGVLKNTTYDQVTLNLFKLNDREKLMIPLASGVSFVYNGKCITHRQLCVSNEKIRKKNYIIFPHMRMENYSTT